MLLQKAAQDEAVVAKLLADPDIDDETVGFHAQQAAEKLLKAWLAHLGVGFPKVHRLETLVELLQTHERRLPDNLSDLGKLTPFATAFRYEDLPLDVPLDRTESLRLVRSLRAFVEAEIQKGPA